MECRSGESHALRQFGYMRRRLVHQDADLLDFAGERGDDRCGCRRVHPPGARREDEAQRVGARLDTSEGIWKIGGSAELGSPRFESDPLRVRRSGPLLAVVTGTLSGDAKDMLNSVNYEAQVTWDEATSVSKRDNMAT